ncbi:MAG: LysR family transcriptional regulator [Lachnospiraceae bacterium]|nr:LysR family transcriptional regulator [Lachnospiraceae bacterium]
MYENLNNYRIFYTVASLGNISKAADKLFISQPAISKSISNLEKGLGVTLFSRTSKGVSLTEEGEILYQHIGNAFDSINQAEDEIKKIHDLGIGQLKIGVSTSLCKHILLDYLKDFIDENPHIKVTIRCHSTKNTLNLLSDGKIDLGLICETDIPKGFTYKELTTIHDIFVTSDSYLDNLHLRETDHVPQENEYQWMFAGNITSFISDDKESTSDKLKSVMSDLDKPSPSTDSALDNISRKANMPGKLSIKDILEKSNLMLLEKNNVTRTHIDAYLASEGIYPNQVLEVNNMDLLIDFASIGMGVASVVREFALDYLETGKIIELPLEKEIEKRTVGFIYSSNKNKSTVLNKFLDFCNN